MSHVTVTGLSLNQCHMSLSRVSRQSMSHVTVSDTCASLQYKMTQRTKSPICGSLESFPDLSNIPEYSGVCVCVRRRCCAGAGGAPPPACNCAPAAAVLKLPLPSINTNTSHHRICRRCAAPCLQLCACRCCSHDSVPLLYVASVLHWHGVSCEQTQYLTPPFLQYIYLTPPYLQKVRRPLHATKRLPLLFSCSLSLQSEPIPHTTVGVCRCSSRR